jgi:hypothetical protein
MDELKFEIVKATSKAVEVHSDYALQFTVSDGEKRVANGRLRTAIQKAVAHLRRTSGELLCGAYVTRRSDPYDAENLVYYNVGLGAFRGLDDEGVRFETARIEEALIPRAHCWTYRLVCPETPFSRWTLLEPPVARWRDVPIQARPSSKTRPGHFWLAMREAALDWDRSRCLTVLFGLRLCLTAPPGSLISLCDPMKPMFDGVIAGLHSNPGDISDPLFERLARETDPIVRSHDRVRDHLTSPGVLGPCRGLFRLKGSAFWHPRDEDCVAGELRLTEESSSAWRLSGQIHDVAPVHDRTVFA